MVYYLQLECTEQTAVFSNSRVIFDNEIALSHDVAGSQDFWYHDDGTIDIVNPGTYAVFWYVAGMTGFSTDGQFYQLKKLNKQSDDNHHWDDPGVGSTNHIKVSSTPGFAIVNVTQYELDHNMDDRRATIALFNTADEEIKLTFFEPKASIMILGLDFTDIQYHLSAIDQQIYDLFQQLQAIENFVEPSNVDDFLSPQYELAGLGVSVIHSGYTYNFWGTGTLNSGHSLGTADTYYLLRDYQYAPLQLYQGDPTIGTLWILLPSPPGDVYSVPVRFDGTGIYFNPPMGLPSLPAGTAFRFTQALILFPAPVSPPA